MLIFIKEYFKNIIKNGHFVTFIQFFDPLLIRMVKGSNEFHQFNTRNRNFSKWCLLIKSIIGNLFKVFIVNIIENEYIHFIHALIIFKNPFKKE
jgi:hypothetical protein